jgi:hypothetical protein
MLNNTSRSSGNKIKFKVIKTLNVAQSKYHYFSTQSPRKMKHLSHLGTSLKMLLALAFASIHKKQFTLIFVLSTTFQELH